MSVKRWRTRAADEKAVKKLCAALGISTLAARTLVARGASTPELASELIAGNIEIESPLALRDIDRAAVRINDAIDSEETIGVFGDYDVDGLTSTTLMLNYLFSRGANAVCSLPARDASGYGLSLLALDNMKKAGVSLIITVDNGITAHEEIAYASSLGIDVVVCDHHLPAETLPGAYAVVDPLRSDDESAFKELAGVGVALKLAAATEGCSADELLEEYGYLVALGTVSDVMPLVGENRAMVRLGIDQLHSCDNLGLRALCKSAGVNIESIDAQGVAFTIAPRLNAAGRMGSAETALRLLLSEDVDEAIEIADELDALNRERQTQEAQAAKAVMKCIDDDPSLLRRPIIIVSGEKLHAGVIGITCSRLVERYGKPVIIISTENGSAKGSGRGAGGFSLHSAIASCADILIKFGGHAMAAGFVLETKDIEEFRRRMYEYCKSTGSSPALPELEIDSEISLGEISENSVSELASLAPFGRGFEEPVFAVTGLTAVAIAPLGERHSRITFRQGAETISGAWFSVTPQNVPFKVGETVNAAFCLSIYENSARSSVSVRFRDVVSGGVTECSLDSLCAYRSLCTGRELEDDEREMLSLSREDIAVVYRAIRKEGIDCENIAALYRDFPSLGVGAVRAAIDVLVELELAELSSGRNGRYIVRAKDNARKRELCESSIFCEIGKAPSGAR